MSIRFFAPLLTAFLAALPALAAPLSYPEAPRVDHVDEYHGVQVADPYRWLEDLDSEQTRTWIEAQNRLTDQILESIPERAVLRERLDQLQDFERYSTPFQEGKRWFWFHNSGLQNQSVLYTAGSLEAPGRVLLDPNTLSEEGTVALSGTSISHDGRHLAYGLAEAGSDWNTWRVRDIQTGQDLPDVIRWVKFSGASWTRDGLGFYYSRYPTPEPGQDLKAVNHNHTLYYHRLGTPQEEDVQVFAVPEHPDWSVGGGVTEDGRWLVIQVERPDTDNGAVWVQDLARPDSPLRPLPDAFKARFRVIESEGDTLLVQTDLDAPRFRLLGVDLSKEEPAWHELIPQGPEKMESVGRVGNRLFVEYLHDAHSRVAVHDLQGKPLGEVPLPGLGTAGGFSGRRQDTETFYAFTSFTVPTEIHRYDLASGKSTLWKRPRLTFDPAKFQTRQVFITSKDGTRVPMFLSHRKDLVCDGRLPVLMYAYGGFNYSLTPYFSATSMAWMEAGGVYAVPNLRGGGEYGEEWHQAGTRTRKQNVFDDFIAAGEWLVANNYTNPSRLAIMGGSNGGLLVGACMTQRPDLFGAAIPQVGVMDMLRFASFTIGYAWVADYGDVKDPEEFAALHAYSPYHNLQPGTHYPPTLVTTADHDDRVFPAHSFKFAAALQQAQGGPAPTLIRIETRAGHGAGKPTSKRLDEAADILAFLVRALGVRMAD